MPRPARDDDDAAMPALEYVIHQPVEDHWPNHEGHLEELLFNEEAHPALGLELMDLTPDEEARLEALRAQNQIMEDAMRALNMSMLRWSPAGRLD